MTTIAIDKFGTIAADGLTTHGYGTVLSRSRKKIAVANGMIYAVSGAVTTVDALIEWYVSGHNPKDVPPTGENEPWAMLVCDKGQWLMFSKPVPYPEAIEPPVAIGSGSDYAMGAMYAGATAQEAVEISCRLNTHSGGEIQIVNVAEALGLQRLEAAE